MKKSINLSIAALAALCVLSCQKESNELVPEITPEIENNKEVTHNPNFVPTVAMKFEGTTDNEINTGTKTSIDGTTIKWAAHDGIYLFDGVAPRAFKSDNDAVATTVDFEGSASAVEKYYAIYPSGKLSTVETKKVITTTIPTFQTATVNSFAPKANVAVAYSTEDLHAGGSLQFKNIGAVVKFKIHDDNTDVRKVRLDALNGEDMSGKVNVTFESNGTFTTTSVHADSESCVILEGETDLDPSKTYYMAIKPGTYAGGFKITLIRADGSYRSIKNTTSNKLDRNDLMDFGELLPISSWKSGVKDELTASKIGQSGYGDWDSLTDKSDAEYAGNSTTYSSTAIQIRYKEDTPSGIVSTTSGGQLSKIDVVWNSNTYAGRTLNVYGKKTAYANAADLYDNDKKGTLIGTIVKGTSTELTVTGDYTYVGLLSADGAMYLNELNITWGEPAPTNPVVIGQNTAITGLSTDTVPLAGGSATFTVESNGPWTIASNHPEYASVSVDEDDLVTVTFETAASQQSAIITVTPADGEAKTVTITQKDADVYTLYTGSIVEGDYIIYYSGKAMKNTIDKSRFTYEEVTPVNDKISDPASSIVWHIAASGDYWTIYNAAVSKYAAGTATKNQGALIASITDLAKWTVTVNTGLYEFENLGRQSQSNPDNKWLRNNGASGFACYGTGTGGALTLYKK